MKRGTWKFTTGAALFGLLATGRTGSAADRALPAFVVYVSEQSGVEPGVLVQARSQADRIFKDAGVRLVWLDVEEDGYNPGCHSFSVLVTLLSTGMVRELSVQGLSEKVLGSAAHAAGRAFIFPGRIDELAANTRRPAHELMGRVIAHEIGHLLLPAGHTHYGIMAPGMETDPTASSRFTLPQARAIRRLVESKEATFARGAGCGN